MKKKYSFLVLVLLPLPRRKGVKKTTKQKLETDHHAITLLNMKLIWEAKGRPTEFLTVPDALFQINSNVEYTVPRQVLWNVKFS